MKHDSLPIRGTINPRMSYKCKNLQEQLVGTFFYKFAIYFKCDNIDGE